MNLEGVTIILTTHYLEEAERLCRNIAIIDKGAIIENTSMQKLLARLEKETFVLDLESSLNEAPPLKDFECKLDNPSQLTVTVKKDQELNIVFDELSKLGVSVLSMRNQTGRLEELFLNLVEPDPDLDALESLDKEIE